MNFHWAQAQAVVARPRFRKACSLGMDSAASAALKGMSPNFIEANAHARFATKSPGNYWKVRRACEASAVSKGWSAKASLATDHAKFTTYAGWNSEIFAIDAAASAALRGWSRTMRPANAHAVR